MSHPPTVTSKVPAKGISQESLLLTRRATAVSSQAHSNGCGAGSPILAQRLLALGVKCGPSYLPAYRVEKMVFRNPSGPEDASLEAVIEMSRKSKHRS